MPGSHPPPRSSGQVALYPWLWGPLPVAVRPPLLLPRPATSSRTLGRWTPCRPRSWAIEGDLKKGINPHNMTIWSFFDMINHGTWGKTWKTSERDVRIIKWYTARSCIPNLHPILILIRLLLLIIIIIILLRDGLSAQALLTVQSTTSKRAKAARSIWSCLSQGPDRCQESHKTQVVLPYHVSAIQKWMMPWQFLGTH